MEQPEGNGTAQKIGHIASGFHQKDERSEATGIGINVQTVKILFQNLHGGLFWCSPLTQVQLHESIEHIGEDMPRSHTGVNDGQLCGAAASLLMHQCSELLLHGTVEASTANVRQTFSAALNDALRMQDTVYGKMSVKGWYAPEQAEQTKVNTLKQKFSGQ